MAVLKTFKKFITSLTPVTGSIWIVGSYNLTVKCEHLQLGYRNGTRKFADL